MPGIRHAIVPDQCARMLHRDQCRNYVEYLKYLEEEYSMFKLASLLVTFLLLTAMPVLADIRGTDATGKAVILRSDGTWSYIIGGGGGTGKLNMAVGKPCAANRPFVTSLYQSILDRQPDASGLNYWTGRLNSGQTKKWLITQIFKSREYTGFGKSNREFVRDAYQAVLGRQPEPAGHSSWIRNLKNNMSRDTMIGHFLNSTEYKLKMARCGTINPPPPPPPTNNCRSYTNQAIAQQQENKRRGCGFAGARWHVDYNRHYNSCLRSMVPWSTRETNIRKNALKKCTNTGGKAKDCSAYANHAIHQQNTNIRVKCNYSGPRWHTNYNRHYNGCMGNTPNWRGIETKARGDALARCVGAGGTGRIAYCKKYSDQALRQQNVNLRRKCNYSGRAWHLDYNRHNNWCINAKTGAPGREAKARADAIARCVARPNGGKATYLGCFVDKPDRDIKGYSFGSGQMTNQLCINTCRTKGFSIAATQFSSQCFCGNSSGRYGRAPKINECKYPCKGNDKTNCGGYWRNSVYKIGAVAPPPPRKAIKLISKVSSRSSSAFKRNTDNRLRMNTTRWDKIPYRMAPVFSGTVRLARNQRAILAGNAAGTAGWGIDNFLLIEIGNKRLVTGAHEPVIMAGRAVQHIGRNSQNIRAGEIDLTAYLQVGRPVNLRVTAFDYGGIGHVSDVFLILQ